MQKKIIHTQDEARQHAIDWQNWTPTQDLSTYELVEWNDYFLQLAERYDLVEEFTENGII